jgi:peptide deformylase
MAVKPILTIPNPILTQKTLKVKEINKEVLEVVQDLIDTLEVAEDPEGAGLAASQIGSNLKIIVVKNFYEDPGDPSRVLSDTFALINPKIIAHSNQLERDWEGCLSVPDTYGKVDRFTKIKLSALNTSGQEIRLKASDFFSRVIQHEMDQLDGILFTERVVGKIIPEKELDKILGHK